MWMGRAINFVQKFTSKDSHSVYSHAGIILNPQGKTFEALWTNKSQNLFEAYQDKKVLVARNNNMTPEAFTLGWVGIKHHKGKIYAGHRLLFFLLCPPLAKYFCLGLGVCSELTMKFLYRAYLAEAWKGWTPDDIHDMVRHYREYDIIYEGACPKTESELAYNQI
jgi:hypothetical protein